MNHCTAEQLVAFEDGIKGLWEAGELPYLLHLCGGNETQLIKIFEEVQPGDWVFSGHRSHYHALLSGMRPTVLWEKIRRGDSMFVFSKLTGDSGFKIQDSSGDRLKAELQSGCQVNFVTSSILAGTCAIAAGVAWEEKRKAESEKRKAKHVWCFLGDGAEDEGHFYEAVRFVEGRNLPCTFIIEDNDRQVETNKLTRHGKDGWSRVGGLYGLESLMPHHVRRYHYTAVYPHAGSGCKQYIVFKPVEGRGTMVESQ